MQGISEVGHTVEWPGSGARQQHDGGEHSARGEVHREDFVYGGGCCVVLRACACVCMCVGGGRGGNRGVYIPERPLPQSADPYLGAPTGCWT